MKIMIAYPMLPGKGSPMLTQNRQFQWYNMGSYIFPVVPAYAASLLKQNGYEVVFADYIAQKKSMTEFHALIRRERPDIIAFETKTPVVGQHWRLIDTLKSEYPDIVLALMGDHVTALPLESMQSCSVDYVLTGGDFDFSLLALANHFTQNTALEPGTWFRKKGQIKNNGEFELKHDLSPLPFIDRSLTQAHLYGEKWKKRTPFYYTMFGRDCPWAKCTFCSWTTVFPTFRAMTVERALDEIGYLIEYHGAKEIFDDSGTFPPGKWLKEFCEGMILRGYHKKILFSCNMRFDYLQDPEIPRLMKRAGFRKIKSGLESANQKTLDRVKKGTTVYQIITGCKNAANAGLDVHLTVMVGYPWETKSDAQRTVKLAQYLMRSGYAEMLQATVVVPYPGTPLFDEAVRNNWLAYDKADYEKFDQRGSVFITPDMNSQEIVGVCNEIYRTFFTPRYVVKQVLKNIKDPVYLYRGLKSIINHLHDFS
ncbi:MAG: radical SAM protein [Deltaproteobacteria bacterium]|nr:radical SAM protein [Deltaproteobacteria bacterium]